MEQPKSKSFDAANPAALGMAEVVKRARAELAAINNYPVDAVIRCDKDADGAWTVVLEVIESPARMGENDFLAAYALTIDGHGDVTAIDRTDRYRREDGRSA
ncbi:MAG: gas vesicle protein GvpO [Pseudomonadota bacterium]